MLLASEWTTPDGIGVIAGIVGVLFGLAQWFWSRHESRLDALSQVLHPFVRSAQHLYNANDSRRKCEQLKASFPDGSVAPESVARVNALVGEYNESTNASEDEFRKGEAELASRSFRFPDRVSRLLKAVQESVSEYRKYVNNGMFERADLQFSKYRDDHKKVVAIARGWRLADPIEGVRRWFTRPKAEDALESRYELSEKEMNAVLDLVHKRATSQRENSYAVHPPKKLLDNPEIAKSDDVIPQLEDSIFTVVFQDGTTVMMSLVELVVFTYNLIVLHYQWQEVARIAKAVGTEVEQHFNVSFKFSIDELMRPEMVKTLLSKIEFSKTASDE